MKQTIHDPEILARMESAFELYELAEQIMLQNIRRRHPGLNEEEVEERLVVWLQHCDDADRYGRPTDHFLTRQ